jgi:hypothetical protein
MRKNNIQILWSLSMDNVFSDIRNANAQEMDQHFEKCFIIRLAAFCW